MRHVTSKPSCQCDSWILNYNLRRYTYALQSLSHVLLLNPQNPFYVLQAAETAYTAGDVPLAIKNFLIVIDMTDEQDPKAAPQGITTRAWYGVQLVSPWY
jgi:ER membrane protein complex subunit 2